MLKLHYLRDFVAIAQSLSVRGAARELGLAQPALTRSLRELEQTLGVSLVDRHARGIQLTPEGTRFLIRAKAALNEMRRAQEEALQMSGTMQGNVAVALSGAAMLALLPQAFLQFRRAYPQVRLRIQEGPFPTIESQLRDGSVDFYIGPQPERVDRLLFQVETWFGNERRVLVRRNHPMRTATSLEELVSADWILTGLREHIEQELTELFELHGFASPTLVTRVDSLLGTLLLLASTDSVALLPRQCADSFIFEPLVVQIPVREALAAPDIVMITRANLPLTPAAERLSTLLRRGVGHPLECGAPMP